jgi:hypothetical protein
MTKELRSGIHSHGVTTAELYRMRQAGPNIAYLFNDSDPTDEMSYATLEFCVRNDERFAFADGDTIAEAGSHSAAELWSDVIVPAIIAGTIERYEHRERIVVIDAE